MAPKESLGVKVPLPDDVQKPLPVVDVAFIGTTKLPAQMVSLDKIVAVGVSLKVTISVSESGMQFPLPVELR